MNDSMNSNTRGAKACAWSLRLAATGAVFTVIGLVCSRSGLMPMLTMLLLTFGSLAFIIGGICGATGLIRGRNNSNLPTGMAWGAVALAIVAIVNTGTMMGGGGAPIHDISTDTTNPPEFVAIVKLRGPDDNPAEYAGPESAELQAEAYPDIETLVLLDPRALVFTTALEVVDEMGWELVDSNAAEGRIEATATTPFVGFKDDIVIRVSAKSAETHVDIRSKSRIGKGDMGVNAKRIREFSAKLIEAVAP